MNPGAGEDRLPAALRIAKALADRQRVRILAMLAPGELCVCQVVEVLALAPSTVSKHLSILNAAGLVASRKEGRWGRYRLPEGTAGSGVRTALAWLRGAVRNDRTIARDGRRLRSVVARDPQSLCRRQRERAR